jgi:type II secretory pathway pseudopilin PulG
MRQGENQVRKSSSRAFTLIELLVAIGIIFLLMGLLLAGLRLARGSARASTDRATLTSLKNAITQFKQTLGFVPPLVRDNRPSGPVLPGIGGPLSGPSRTAGTRPVVFVISDPAQLKFLCGYDTGGAKIAYGQPDWRFSEYSIAYYVIGALPKTVDGVDGPGSRAPRRDGSFETAGKTIQPYFDTSKNAKLVYTENEDEGRIVLRDSYNTPYRYYRWTHGHYDSSGKYTDQVLVGADVNVPWIFWNSSEPADIPPEAKDAEFAIVSAGPDGVFGDEDIATLRAKLSAPSSMDDTAVRDKARKDNIVEFGR